MDFGTFGKNSGPNAGPPRALKFGNFPQPRSPPPPPVARFPRDQAFEAARVPPSTFQNGHYVFHPSQPSAGMPRPSASPPKMRSNSHSSQHGPLSSTLEHYNKEEVSKRPMSFPAAKKTKLCSLSSSDQVFQEKSITGQDEINRELEAKAKRLVRFKDELNQPMKNDPNIKDQTVPTKRQLPVMVERRKVNGNQAVDMAGNSSCSYIPSDYEAMDSSTIITGSC